MDQNYNSALRKLNDCAGIDIYVMDHTEIMDEIKNDGIQKPEKIRPWILNLCRLDSKISIENFSEAKNVQF